MNSPSFIIVGAMRSGTTSLYKYICQHLLVRQAKVKEIGYFWNQQHKGMRWYLSRFPRGYISGEATVHYLSCSTSAHAIKCALPNIKIIAILRNPIERAWSHYHYNSRKVLSFEDTIKVERSHLQILAENTPQYQNAMYLAKGHYAQQLEPYFSLFDVSQILVLNSTDYYNDEWNVLQRVFKFLELPASDIEIAKPYPVNQYSAMLSETRVKLQAYYELHNERLWQLLGENWGW